MRVVAKGIERVVHRGTLHPVVALARAQPHRPVDERDLAGTHVWREQRLGLVRRVVVVDVPPFDAEELMVPVISHTHTHSAARATL